MTLAVMKTKRAARMILIDKIVDSMFHSLVAVMTMLIRSI